MIQTFHSAVVARKNAGGGGGGGTSPGLTSIIAWYDFADATDADGGTYNLSAQNAPSYTAGPPSYGTSGDGTGAAHWQQSAIDAAFGNTAGDWSFVCRFRAKSGIASGDRVFVGNGGRTNVEYNSTGIRGGVGSATAVNSSVVPSEETWYTVVVSRDNTSGNTSISVNGATFVTGATAASFVDGNYIFGGTSSTNANPVDIDFCGFWNKTLTQDNVTWLYNSDGTRTYAEL